MNIYEKIQLVRNELSNKKLKKSGKNTYSNYDYYELGDFLPQINNLMHEHKLFSLVKFDADTATLTILDSEKPEDRIEFFSPMASIELKGAHAIQNIGAIETYQRRYLYMMAFEISESDIIDQSKPIEKKQVQNDEAQNDEVAMITEAQVTVLRSKMKQKGKEESKDLEKTYR